MTYRPRQINQFHDDDGTPWGGSFQDRHGDCWATIGAEALDAGTRGQETTTPPKFRKEAGVTTLGGNVGDIERVLKAHGVWAHVPTGGASWELIRKKLKTGRYYIANAVDYDAIPDAKSCQPDFDGLHMIGLLGYDDMGKLLYDDPLCGHTKKTDESVIRAASAKCARQVGAAGHIVCFVRIPKDHEDPPPDDDTCSDVEDERDALQAELDAIQAILSGEGAQ